MENSMRPVNDRGIYQAQTNVYDIIESSILPSNGILEVGGDFCFNNQRDALDIAHNVSRAMHAVAPNITGLPLDRVADRVESAAGVIAFAFLMDDSLKAVNGTMKVVQAVREGELKEAGGELFEVTGKLADVVCDLSDIATFMDQESIIEFAPSDAVVNAVKVCSLYSAAKDLGEHVVNFTRIQRRINEDNAIIAASQSRATLQQAMLLHSLQGRVGVGVARVGLFREYCNKQWYIDAWGMGKYAIKVIGCLVVLAGITLAASSVFAISIAYLICAVGLYFSRRELIHYHAQQGIDQLLHFEQHI